MKDIKPIKGKYYLQRVIAEGEHERQDFKYAISDAMKIARSLSAFANHSGGSLLIGVKDNGAIAGVRNEEDIYVVEQAAELYCRPAQHLEFTALRADEGAVVIRATIEPAATLPVEARDPDGRWQAYYRVADENIVADPLMVSAWRRKYAPEPLSLMLTDAQRAIIDLLRSQGASSLRRIALNARISQASAREIVTTLAAMDILTFTFHHPTRRFLISLPD